MKAVPDSSGHNRVPKIQVIPLRLEYETCNFSLFEADTFSFQILTYLPFMIVIPVNYMVHNKVIEENGRYAEHSCTRG